MSLCSRNRKIFHIYTDSGIFLYQILFLILVKMSKFVKLKDSPVIFETLCKPVYNLPNGEHVFVKCCGNDACECNLDEQIITKRDECPYKPVDVWNANMSIDEENNIINMAGGHEVIVTTLDLDAATWTRLSVDDQPDTVEHVAIWSRL